MKSSTRLILFATLIAAMLATAGCLPRGPKINTWVAGQMVNLTNRTQKFDDRTVYDPRAGKIDLFSAGNETVSFQLVVDADIDGAKNVRVKFSNLLGTSKNRIEAKAFTAFRAMPVHVSEYPPWYLRLVDVVPKPADFYDALVPFARANVRPRRRMVVWVDLAVPQNAAGDKYTGSIKVSADGLRSWKAVVSLKVYDFVLPNARPLAAIGGFDHAELFRTFIKQNGKPYVPTRMNPAHPLVRQGLVLMRQLMKLSHDHRLDLFDKTMHPLLKRDQSGKVQLDWSDYDAIVLPYIKGSAFSDRIGSPAWPIPFSQDWPAPDIYGGSGSDDYITTAGEVIAECGKHFADVLDQPGKMFVWPHRRQADQHAYDAFTPLAKIARGADAKLAILSTLPLNPPKPARWAVPENFSRLADIFAPPGKYLPQTNKPKKPNRLGGTWFTPDTPPYTPGLGVVATAAEARVIPWFAMKYNCSAVFLPEVMHWSGDPFSTTAGSQTRLFYPGNSLGLKQVLPSVRLKRLRRGMQDITYLWLLRQRKRGRAAQTIINSLARYAGLDAARDNYLDPPLDGWVQDPKAWSLARRLMAEEIQAAIRPGETTNDMLMARRMDWRIFEEKTRTVRVEQIRSQVRQTDDGKLQTTIRLDLYNEFSRDVDVIVKIEKLPKTWQMVKGKARIVTFAPSGRQVVQLQALGDRVPAGPDGKMTIPISISIDGRWHKKIRASVAFIVAGFTGEKITIDGNLNDWPTRKNNTAGRFALVGKRGRTLNQAHRQTRVQVLRDKDNLYIAFRCMEPRMRKMVVKPNNMVHYQQLMACGEDLVEIILDGGYEAETSSDLFHIVVKPNGAILAERLASPNAIGADSNAWPVRVKAAVLKTSNAWNVELKIPLSAFGNKSRRKLWGVNFTRFATARCESSSWSGAARHFYDPRNSGTMFVPPYNANNHKKP